MEQERPTDPDRAGEAPAPWVYLDNAATTPIRDEVLEAMTPFLKEEFGNASSLHALGVRASRALEQARSDVAEALGVPSPELVVFTSGATEANNLIVKGLSLVAGRSRTRRGSHAVTSNLEHPSVRDSLPFLEDRGWEVSRVRNDGAGLIDLDHLASLIRPETRLVSLIWGNNEIGTRIPAARIASLVRSRNPRCVVHFDAVQCVGKVDLHLGATEIDAVTVSGHKVHGPKGVGALLMRRPLGLGALLTGGGQERGLRSGTENVAFAAGLARAVGLACREVDPTARALARLQARLEEGILAAVPGARFNGSRSERLPHILSVAFPGLKAEILLHHLEREGILVSTGSACSERDAKTSSVLEALEVGEEIATSTVRFSLSRETREDEIDRVLQVLPKVVDEMGSIRA